MNQIIDSLKRLEVLKNLNRKLVEISTDLKTNSEVLNFNDKSFDSLNCYPNECKIISEDIDCDTNYGFNQRTIESYECNWPGCNQVFTDSTLLNEHKRVHTRDKPFICRINNCGKRYSEKCYPQNTSNIHSFKG